MAISEAVDYIEPSPLLAWAQSPNIAADLDETELGRIGETTCREFEIDWNSGSDWREKARQATDLAMQVAQEKQYPWPKAANVKWPLMTTAAIQFAARAYPAIVANQNIVKGKVIGSDGGVPLMTPQGPAMQPGPDGQPMPVWQIEPGAKRKRADRIAAHMSYQLTEEMEEWEEDTDKLLHIVPIVGCAFRKTWYDATLGRNCSRLVHPLKFVVNYDADALEDTPRATEIFDLYPYQITERQRKGLFLDIDIPQSDGEDADAPHEFLEQHRFLDLDEDGYPEPYIVTVHKETQKVVRIVARFDPEGIETNQAGEISRIAPVHYYTKFIFLPSPDGGFYGMGFGTLLGPLNETVNTTINQMLDAGTLQNTGGGFIGAGLRIKGGNMRFRPGEYKRAAVSAGSIRDNVYTLEHPGPSAVLFNLLGLLLEAGKDVSSVKDVLTGEATGANEPATTTLARIEQGLKVFTAIYKRLFRALKREFKKLYRLNKLYLPPEAYFTVLDEQQAISQQDYDTESVDVVPVADPNSVSDMQKLAKAEFLLQFLPDPYFNPMEIRKRLLEAASIEDVEMLLTEPGPNPEVEARKVELMQAGAKMEAELAEIQSKIILNIAKAEGEEAGSQIEAYKAQVDALIGHMREMNSARQIEKREPAPQKG